MTKKTKILVTGFEPFGVKGALFKRNESKEIALRLKKKYPELEILILPVKDSCVQILVSKIESYKPHIIIGMGQTDWKLRIESMCYKGDKMLYSKFAEEIKAKLKFVYDNTGNYYCNDVYYEALSRVPNTVFIHIPIYTKFYKVDRIVRYILKNDRR
jgi:pyroglutamyl-peptidase